jgi:peptide/nickel transport system permease protein
MGRYIFRRLVYSIFVLIGLTMIVFAITHLIGDPARLMLPLDATEAQYLSLRKALGLDQPLYVQFAHFAFQVMRGDFGLSIWQGVPALPLVLSRFPATLYLALSTVAFSTLIALPLGILSAVKPASVADRVTTVLSFAGISTPTFWLALMLILLLAVRFRWFKTSGYGGLQYLALPVLSLSAYIIGRIAQMVRSAMLDEMGKPYVTTARSKGIAERTVILGHALHNAAIPIITLAGHEIANLANGAVVVEVIFGWPGVGQLAITAIERRDFPVIQADVLVVATAVILINFLVDVIYVWVDPRIRYG